MDNTNDDTQLVDKQEKHIREDGDEEEIFDDMKENFFYKE